MCTCQLKQNIRKIDIVENQHHHEDVDKNMGWINWHMCFEKAQVSNSKEHNFRNISDEKEKPK